LGGAQALGIDGEIGNFLPGKAFDAVIADTATTSSPIDTQEADSLEDTISKFVFLGDDRNFVAVYVNGIDRLPTCSL
jgi:guanine deaminase